MTITTLPSHPIPDQAPSLHQGVGMDEGSNAHLLARARRVPINQRRDATKRNVHLASIATEFDRRRQYVARRAGSSVLRSKWPATADEDGHYSFAVAL